MTLAEPHATRPQRAAVLAVCAAASLGAALALVHAIAAARGGPSSLQLFAGYNTRSGYAYSLESDCFAEGHACAAGSWCNVVSRENWYPWDVSYISRGRCLPYAREGDACEPALEPVGDGGSGGIGGQFPVRSTGEYYARPTLCAPELVCTADTIAVLPPTCVRRRTPADGCMSTREHGCAGRSDDGSCPDGRYCATSAATRLGKVKAEQCASMLIGWNGPSFAFGMAGTPDAALRARAAAGPAEAPPADWLGLPNDANLHENQTDLVHKHIGAAGQAAARASEILRPIWPYPICDEGEQADCPDGSVLLRSGACSPCTAFPLRFVARDADGGAVLKGGLCRADAPSECADAAFLMEGGEPIAGLGPLNYHCAWAVLHHLSMNGRPSLAPAQAVSFRNLVAFVMERHNCKLCRSNFASLVEHFGLPDGYERATYARWLSRAHNNANEHRCARARRGRGRAARGARATAALPARRAASPLPARRGGGRCAQLTSLRAPRCVSRTGAATRRTRRTARSSKRCACRLASLPTDCRPGC